MGKSAAELGATRFVGIDWAAEEHAVSVLDESGRGLMAFTIAHSREGLETLVNRLAKLGSAGAVPVAVERDDGRLVDRLLEAGQPVVKVSPKAIKAWREAEVASGAESDAADAEVIAEYLRLRQHRLSVVEPFSEATRALRSVCELATTSCTSGWPPPIVSKPAWTPTGLAPSGCSATSSRTSPLPLGGLPCARLGGPPG